jgi:hypothetical protein
MGGQGWDCLKLNLPMKRAIDARVDAMVAKSDNCEGKTQEFLNPKPTERNQ